MGAGQHQVRRGEVRPEIEAQALDGAPGHLERDTGVEQLLDDLELQHVVVRVAALRPAASRLGEGRP